MEKERIEVLVRRAQNGDLQAMEQLLEAAHTPVSYQCRKMMPRPEDAQDLTQEVLLVVYQSIGKLEEPKAFWSWLNRITATRCMNALTRTHVDLQFAEDEEGHSILDDLEETDEQSIPDKAIDNAETARMIDEIVSNLPEAQRLSTLMYYYDEMSIKEIAQIMGVSENTVKSRLKLARKAIEEKVLDYEKQGVKLYGVSILPFLWYFLRNAAKNETDIGAAVACASNVMAAGTATGSVAAAAGDAAISGCAVVHFSANKVVAMILAGLVAIGGMAFGAILAVNKCCYPVPDTMCLHEWTDASCTNPKICCKCDSTEGEALGHNWVEVNCETPQLCTICGATKGEISGHKWEEANCEMPKTCIICGETVGDVVHVWREANYQMPESCSICGTTNGRALTAAFETYGLSITDVELGRKYSYVTSCNSQPYKTTGQAVFSHFRVFEGDETHKAVDDYEWYSVAVDITFNDEYAQSYGMYPFVFYCDYYTGGVWACDSENPKTEVGTIFTINYCGENYTECMIYSKDAGSLGWVGNTCIYHCEFNYRVPVGYDGIMFGLLDPSVDPQEDETVADFADDNTLLFRLDNSFAMEGYEPITLVSYTQINDNWYVMQDCAVFAEPSDESEQLLSCEKGRVVMVYCNGTNGWSYGTLRGVTGYIRTEYMVDELPDNPGTRWTLQIVGVGQGFIYVEVPDLAPKPAGRADPETGLSWDGVSPIIYTYPDGTRGTEPIEGATYEVLPGVIATYHVYHDEVGRVLDSTCRDCGKTIKNDSRGKYCVQFPSEGGFCTSCGQDVEPYTCHTCTNYTDGTSYSAMSMDFFTDKKDFLIYELKLKTRQAFVNKDFLRANILLDELEAILDNPTEIDRQFILVHRILYGEKELPHEEKLKQLETAIQLTCPKYKHNHIPRVLSYEEIIILNNIAICYNALGDRDRTISILTELKEYYDRHVISVEEALRTQPMILYNLSKFLGLSGRYDECIEICDQGIRLARVTGRCPLLAKTLYNRAWSLLKRNHAGDGEAAEISMRQAYHVSDAMGETEDAEFIRNYYLQAFSKDIKHDITE